MLVLLYSVLPSLYSVETLFGAFFIITGANFIVFGALFLIFGANAIIFGTSLFGYFFIIFGAYFIIFGAFFDMIVTSLFKGPYNLEIVWGETSNAVLPFPPFSSQKGGHFEKNLQLKIQELHRPVIGS